MMAEKVDSKESTFVSSKVDDNERTVTCQSIEPF